MKKLLPVIFCALMAQGVYAADDGGFKKMPLRRRRIKLTMATAGRRTDEL